MSQVIRFSALLACACVVGMVAIYLTTGVGQDALQFVHSPEEYQALLLGGPGALRAVLTLDNLFIVLYTTTFLALLAELAKNNADPLLLRVTTGLLVALAMLDLIENMHFLVMLWRAERGAAPSEIEIAAQVLESLVKFHVSYLGLFLLGLCLPRRTTLERVLVGLSLFVQAPVGVLIYTVPRAVAVPLVFVRFTYFVVALAMVAAAFGQRASSGSSAPA